ncbi:MAG: hypothetical protein ACI8PZ_003565 [Myxococcota bacterium]
MRYRLPETTQHTGVHMSLRLSALLWLIALTACNGENGADGVGTVVLESGTYTLVDDGASVTLTVDVDALTFSLDEDGGDSTSGTLTLADEADWAECCYLNGTGHTEFETFRMDPASFVVGPVDVTDAALNATPTIQEFSPAANSDSGFRFE